MPKTSCFNSDLKPFQFLTARQVNELTGIATQTLANNRHKRKGIPYSKINGSSGSRGGSIRYALTDVLDFMTSHRIDPEAM